MLLGMDAVQGMQLDVIDIACSDDLIARYAECLPVLCVGDAVLPAPFAQPDVEAWLQHLGSLRKPE